MSSSSYVAVPASEFKAFTQSLSGMESGKVATEAMPGSTNIFVSEKQPQRKGFRPVLLWIIFSIIIGFILYFSHPSIVTNRDRVLQESSINWLALIFWSLLFGAIVLGVVALIMALIRGARERREC